MSINTLKKLLCVKFFLLGSVALFAQNKLENSSVSVNIGDDGIVKEFYYQGKRGKTEMSFRSDDYLKGPALFLNDNRMFSKKRDNSDNLSFVGANDTLSYELNYKLDGNSFVIETTVTNLLKTELTDQSITLKPGINTELLEYPSWNDIFFPTLLRCEKNFFWGYMLNGMGDVVTIASKEPVASWQMEYYLPKHWRGKGGHLIFSYRLDLMHKLPLPERHPQNLTSLAPNESKSWSLYITPVDQISDVKPTLTKKVGLPMIDSEEYTKLPGEDQNVTIYSASTPSVTLESPKGDVKKVKAKKISDGVYNVDCTLGDEVGAYKLKATDKSGYIAEGMLSTRQSYSWYIDKARDAAVFNPQYAASHLESWLGLHSGLLARKYSKNPEVDKAIEDKLNLILSLQWEADSGIPKFMYEMRKVANTAQMVSVLIDAYEATDDIYYLEKARQLAQIVMTFQYETGDYANYTAIFYPAKSMMELLLAEKELRNIPEWSKSYDTHYHSIKRAIDFLVVKKDNILTEGQQTFEDGMLSCSASQISMFALLQTDPELKKHYLEAAEYMINKHRVLDQSIIPDSRMNGGSIRFWEAQYDVLETKKWNFINSPHGWSAWHIYGLWYMYLLTGEEEYLLDTQNAINTCVQVIEGNSGELRWAFVVDPYCEVAMLRPSSKKGHGEYHDTVIGEQYVKMVRNYHYAEDPATVLFGMPRTHGWSCENDVHEIFKCMEEICLTSAYIFEKEDGSFITWNCNIKQNKDNIEVVLADKNILGVHVNVKNNFNISVPFASGTINKACNGIEWLGKSAAPSITHTPEPEKVRILRNGYN